jgi:Domain of unknown function (DUF3598)
MKLKLFPLHTGIWEGTYTRIAPDGKVLWSHKSCLSIRMDGIEWRQTNQYEFSNGKIEFHNFGLNHFEENGTITFDNSRIYGKSWETNCSIILWWEYRNEPGSKLYEIINLLKSNHRMRVWQHTRNGIFEGITMIEEWKTAEQETIPLNHFDQKSFIVKPELTI